MTFSYRSWIACLAFLSMLAAVDAGAATKDKRDTEQPIEITADSLEVLQEQQLAIFRGSVDAIQGDIRLRADKLTVHYRSSEEKKAADEAEGTAGDIRRLDAEGKVFVTSPTETAQGKKGVYDVQKRTIVLTGDVVLTRGENVLKGQKLTMNMDTGRSHIEGGGSGKKGGRVRGLFLPSKKKSD